MEDDPQQSKMFQLILLKLNYVNEITVLDNGLDALDYIFRRNNFKDVRPPDIIFLDLNLPGKSGVEILKEIKSAPDLKHIPVIILTSSNLKRDARLCYQNYANCFITKPHSLAQFEGMMGCIGKLWMRTFA